MPIRMNTRNAIALTAAMLAFRGQAQPIEISGNPAPVEFPAFQHFIAPPLRGVDRVTLGVSLLPTGRLRCWQHGVAVLDEPLVDATMAPGVALLTALGGGRQQLAIVSAGAGLCLVVQDRKRTSTSRLPDREERSP